jgi:hypothetical protein
MSYFVPNKTVGDFIYEYKAGKAYEIGEWDCGQFAIRGTDEWFYPQDGTIYYNEAVIALIEEHYKLRVKQIERGLFDEENN